MTLEPGLDAFVLLIRVPPRFVVDARFEATVESDNQPVHRFGQLQAQDGILHVTLAHPRPGAYLVTIGEVVPGGTVEPWERVVTVEVHEYPPLGS